jgi:hypothetical protein
MHFRQWLCAILAASAALTLGSGAAQAQSSPLKNPEQGTPAIQSIEAISFAPGGVLLIGDGKGKQMVAVETGDTTKVQWTKTEVADIASVLAGRLGATAKDIQILKMAVNPASQTAYFAVRMLAMKKDIVLTLDGNGKVQELALDNVKFVGVPLPGDANVTSVTGVSWAGDRVLVTALAKDNFANKCFSIMAPLGKDGSCGSFSTETFHVAHNQWETKAPIRTMMPYEENGKRYLVGTFTCTPIVKYNLDELQRGAKVKGISVIELGQGNTPQYMFTYDKGGKKYILMNAQRMGAMQKSNPVGPSEFWTAKVDFTILTENEKVNQAALWRTKGKANTSQTDRAEIVATFHGVTHMGQLDAERALVIRKDDRGINLEVLPLP